MATKKSTEKRREAIERVRTKLVFDKDRPISIDVLPPKTETAKTETTKETLTLSDVKKLIKKSKEKKKKKTFLERPVQAVSFKPVLRSVASFIKPKGTGTIVLDEVDKQLFNIRGAL